MQEMVKNHHGPRYPQWVFFVKLDIGFHKRQTVHYRDTTNACTRFPPNGIAHSDMVGEFRAYSKKMLTKKKLRGMLLVC
jgi:hypothetical protein